MFPADASSRLPITWGGRSSSRMARSCSANVMGVSTSAEACGLLTGLGGSEEDMGVGGVISERDVADIRGSSSRSSLKKRRFFGSGGGEESIVDSLSRRLRHTPPTILFK